jgi:murein DD-endopeptidase MepM/ murein hydrolase activator NlpD
MAFFKIKKWLLILIPVFTAGYFIPENHQIPVLGASPSDWNSNSFWYTPWGRSGAHKGIDIFAKEGVPVLAASGGLVVRVGHDNIGGNSVLVLGAKWRFHYYAHLRVINIQPWQWLNAGDRIGAVGTTGNAEGKPAHLHYAIRSLLPMPELYDSGKLMAWSRMFYLDPDKFLTGADNA